MSIEIKGKKEYLKKKITLIRKILAVYLKLLKLIQGPDIIIHHTATSQKKTRFEAINRNHKHMGYSKSELGYYCAYNCLITGDGKAHWARTRNETGQGSRTYKRFHLDICLTGNFMNEEPSPEQLKTLSDILSDISYRKLLGHRQCFATLCPGDNLMKWIKNYQC